MNNEICLPSFITSNPINACSNCSNFKKAVAKRWCTMCEEMMCYDCAKKDADERHHIIVPLVQNLNFTSICSKHKHEKIEMFCADHKQIICDYATKAFHQNCRRKRPIATEVMNTQINYDLSNLENLIERQRAEIEKSFTRQEASSHLVESSMQSEKKCISKKKKDVISHLDSLEKYLHSEIDEKMKILRHQSTLSKSRYNTFSVWIDDITRLKKKIPQSSLFQIIYFIKYRMKEFEEEESNLNSEESVQCLKYQPAEEVLNIETIIPSLGSVLFNSSTLNYPSSVIGKGTEIELLTSIRFKDLRINGCCFLPLHRILTYNSAESFVQIFHFDGSLHRTIYVTHPVKHVNIFNKLILMSGSPTGLSKFDLNNFYCKEIFQLDKPCWKFACLNQNIYYMREKTICVMNASGSIKKEIQPHFEPTDFVISKSGHVYYTAIESDEIFEIPLHEAQRSIYKNSKLKKVHGMVLDENDNLYVVGKESNNIHKILSDRQNATIILNESNGIFSPLGISYNEESKEMMIINDEGSSVHLYKLS